MEYPMINYVSYEDQGIRRSEAHRYGDAGIISAEIKALQEIYLDDSLAKGERIGAYTEYVNRAGGITQLNYDTSVDIFDAEGTLIMTVFGADETEKQLDEEHPQGFFLGPIEDDEYREMHSIVNLDDKSIETIMEMLAPAEGQEHY